MLHPIPPTSFQTPDTPNIPPSVILFRQSDCYTKAVLYLVHFLLHGESLPEITEISLFSYQFLSTCHKSVLACDSAGCLVTFNSHQNLTSTPILQSPAASRVHVIPEFTTAVLESLQDPLPAVWLETEMLPSRE